LTYPAEALERLRELTRLHYPEEYEPRAIFSPSGLEKWKRCPRAGGYRYLLGIKRREVPWAVILELPEPPSTEREARRLYNSLYRPALGVEGHARMQAYYQGEDVDWLDRVGRIMLPGLGCIPHPDDCDHVEAEGEIEIEYRGIRFRGFRDLLLGKADPEEWLLVDHKTTYTFDWIDRDKTIRSVKSPEQLSADTQANLYAFAVMQDHGLESLDCRWVYYRTEGDAAALPVDFTIEFGAAAAKMDRLAEQAEALTEHYARALSMRARDKVHLPQVREYVESALPANTGACDDFGGCEYAAERGGPCKAVARPSELARRAIERQRIRAAMPPRERASAIVKAAKKERPNMGFRDKLKAQQSGTATKEETPAEAVHDEGALAQVGTAVEANDAVEAEAVSAEAPAAEEKPTPPARTRAKKSATAGAPTGSLAQLAADLAAKEAAFIEASSALDAAKAAMREALG
jgi:hypothetical protein